MSKVRRQVRTARGFRYADEDELEFKGCEVLPLQELPSPGVRRNRTEWYCIFVLSCSASDRTRIAHVLGSGDDATQTRISP
jgi:hypothetical protein